MCWARLRIDDLEECLYLNPNRIGDERIGRSAGLACWRWLFQQRAFSAVAVREEKDICMNVPDRLYCRGANRYPGVPKEAGSD